MVTKVIEIFCKKYVFFPLCTLGHIIVLPTHNYKTQKYDNVVESFYFEIDVLGC
jgi:hypothetical protein